MSAPAASSERLAVALARLCVASWPQLADEDRARAAAAADAFAAAPSPSRFLVAARTIRDARRRQRAEALHLALGERAFARGAARLEEVDFVDEATRATLIDQPHELRAGRRLAALAGLLEAHAELAARLRAADAAHVTVQVERRADPPRRR